MRKEVTMSTPHLHPPSRPHALLLILAALLAAALAACGRPSPPAPPAAPARTPPLTFYNWYDDTPPAILAAFARQTGIPVNVTVYETEEEGLALFRTGAAFDLAVVPNHQVAALAAEGLLRPIHRGDLPNFRNVTPSFRGLTYDPDNRYSIPYTWGIVGLIANRDLIASPPTSWDVLWDPAYCGRVAIWYFQGRTLISATLKSLGYSANAEDPAALAAARARLLALRPCVYIIRSPAAFFEALPHYISGQLLLGIGSSHEAHLIARRGFPAAFYFPTEGALLWGNSFVIPTAGDQPAAATSLIDYLLTPAAAAAVANTNLLRVANDAALPLIDPTLRADPSLYPTPAQLRTAELLLPLTPTAEQTYADLWQEFLTQESLNPD
jgi:spermidine/putrescine transport system substrate-binding protein